MATPCGNRWRNLVFWPLTRTYPIVVDVERGFFTDPTPFAFSPDGRWVALPWEKESLGLLPMPSTGERSVRQLKVPAAPRDFSPKSSSTLPESAC